MLNFGSIFNQNDPFTSVGFYGGGTGDSSGSKGILIPWLFGSQQAAQIGNLPVVPRITTGGNTYTGSAVPGGTVGGGLGGTNSGVPGGSSGGGGTVIPGSGSGGGTTTPPPTPWSYPGLLEAPYLMTNWFGKE